MDCHDGCLRFFDGAYYLYGTAYGNTDGFTPANRYVVYRSDDLRTWAPLGDLLDTRIDGVGYRPYVVFNPTTRKYVLWFNWYPKLWEGQFGVALSDRPEGPFKVYEGDVKVAQPKPGDHNLFVDDDGSGYVVYTSIEGDGSGDHGMSVERLNEGYTRSIKDSSGIFATGVEAPAMFKHAGRYICLVGRCCCFCPEGANAAVYVSDHPLDPWTLAGEINLADSTDAKGTPIVAGQQTDVAVLPGVDGPLHVWMADKWGSRPDGIKGHDVQHWEPLRFDEHGLPLPLTGAPTWEYTR
ncbi:MAG: family 43 glycosylhydrolase [Planctomycetota bacterium]